MSHMSHRSAFESSVAGRWKLLACVLAALVAVSFGSVATAQDATPGPECVAPELPPGTPTPMEEEGPPPAEATPQDMGEMDMASPVAAEPVDPRPEAPVGETPDRSTAREINRGIKNVVACVNSTEDGLGAASVLSANLMMAQFGHDNAYDAAQELAGTTMERLQIVGNHKTYEDGRVSADVQYYFGGPFGSEFQLNSERWYLVQDGDVWKLDEIRFTTATTDLSQSVVGVNLTEPEPGQYAIEPNAPSVPATELLTFHAINQGVEIHELVVVQLPEGADPTGLLDGSVSFEELTFIGVVAPLYPQDNADLNLVNLPAGTYWLLCFFPGPDGAPHAANGMWVQFDVTEAE
jgi:hypothetical protein